MMEYRAWIQKNFATEGKRFFYFISFFISFFHSSPFNHHFFLLILLGNQIQYIVININQTLADLHHKRITFSCLVCFSLLSQNKNNWWLYFLQYSTLYFSQTKLLTHSFIYISLFSNFRARGNHSGQINILFL